MIQSIIDQQNREIDELLRLLNLDPDQYRTDGGSVNMLKVRAALKRPDEYPRLTDQPGPWHHIACGTPVPSQDAACPKCSAVQANAEPQDASNEP